MRKTIFILLFLSVFQTVKSQNYPQQYFRSPLDIPLLLSGCFAELRTNHFHTGLDIKTKGVTGLKVYAVADGYISRMQKSHYGYGYVLYMNHPNGYTSVYAHLDHFNPKLEKYFKSQQYASQEEMLNLENLPDTLFYFKKGAVIGYSGNTGHSGGPHLHFEIRDTKTENAINPWLFGFDIADNLPPTLYHIEVFPLTKDTMVYQNKPGAVKYTLSGNGKNYVIKDGASISVGEYSGFAVHTIDMTNNSGNQCGIYVAELYQNDTLRFKQQMEQIDFNYNRYINAHMDVDAYREHKQSYHKSFIDGNNKLGIYPVKKNNGWIHLNRNEKAKMKYVIKDRNGNTSVLNFEIINNANEKEIDRPLCPTPFYWRDTNRYSNEKISIVMNPASIYENLCFEYNELPPRNGMIAPVFIVGDEDIPVQDYFSISIKTDTIPDSLQQKAVGVFINKKGGISSDGGLYMNGSITFKTRSFGKYSVMIDTVPPLITPINIYNGKNMSANTEIQFKVGDNLSGITAYNAFIDDKWVLMHYDIYRGKLIINMHDENIAAGNHQLLVTVSDERGNIAKYEASFIR